MTHDLATPSEGKLPRGDRFTGVNATVYSKEGSVTLATWGKGPDQRRPK
jgi:hypothetical protein